MSEERWIWIPNWDKFQHYKRRNPTWIKNYLELLHDPAYRDLSFAQRGLLHGIWMTYSTTRRAIPDNTAKISRLLGQRVLRVQLDALNHAGFIEIVASNVLAERLQDAIPEVEGEEEKEKDISPNPAEAGDGEHQKQKPRDKGTNPRAKGTNPRAMGLHMRAKGTNPRHLRKMDSLRKFVSDYWDEYPNREVLVDELTDKGCRHDEAVDLVETERLRREGKVMA